MIQRKQGTCIDCPPDDNQRLIYAKKRCEKHYWKSLQSNKSTNKKICSSVCLSKKPAKENILPWFKYFISLPNPICENCGEPIAYISDHHAISCQAHILPKQHFKSIQSNLDNHMLLCSQYDKNNCHWQYDSNWEKASKMHVFAKAKVRFQKFFSLITSAETKRIPDSITK